MPIPISAFPYNFDMVAAHAGGSSAGAVANADGQNILSNTGGWNDGPWSRIIPPSIDEIYCGFGNFFFPANTTRFNVRCMIRAGNELYRTTGSKMIIASLNAGASGDRAMGISAEGTAPHAFTHWTHASRNINSVGNPATYPNAGPFHFASAAVPKSSGNYQGEWVCYEFEAVIGGSVSVYIHTQDGLIAKGQGNPFSSSDYPVVGTFYNFGLGWYWGPNQGSYPGMYLDIGDVVVSNQYIGPPAGFLGAQTMTFPADSIKPASSVYDNLKKHSTALKSELVNMAAKPTINRELVLSLQRLVVDMVTRLDGFVAGANTNGVNEHARAQERRPTLDLEAEWVVSRAAIVSLLDWTVANYPTAANGNLSVYGGWSAAKVPSNIDLTGAQATAYKAQINAVVATLG